MEAFLIVGTAGLFLFAMAWLFGIIDKNVMLCLFGFHKMEKPKPGCIGIIRCERKGGEYNEQCKHTIVYNWTDK